MSSQDYTQQASNIDSSQNLAIADILNVVNSGSFDKSE